MKFGVRKLESWGYLPDGEEIMTLARFLHFDTIPARDGQTDGRTDRYVAVASCRKDPRYRLQLPTNYHA